MHLCRTHICKLGVLLAILLGYGLNLAQPLSASQHSNAFTRWLQSVVKEDHDRQIRQELEELQSYKGELAPLIQKASRIVHENNDDFRLPVDQNTSSRADVYQLLLKKWNRYKSDKAMQPLSLPMQDSKNLTVYPRHSYGFSQNGANNFAFTPTPLSHHSYSPDRLAPNPSRVDAIPLIGGTAIGAP